MADTPADQPPESAPQEAAPDAAAAAPAKRSHKRKEGNPPREHRRPAGAISQALYEAMWEAFRDGHRTSRQLARLMQVGLETAQRAIKSGWPKRGWPSFLDRAKLHDAQVASIREKEAIEKARAELSEWGKTRERLLGLADLGLATAGQMAKGLLEASQSVKYTRSVTHRDGKGRAYTVEVPLSVTEVAEASRKIAASFQILSQVKQFWINGGKPGDEAAFGPPPADLTEDQLAHIVATGQLPPGVTDDMVAKALSGVKIR